MTAWSALFPDLLPHLPGCPVPLVEHELKRAAQVFCAESRAWRVMLDPIAVPSNTKTVSVGPSDSGQSLVRIEQVWYDGKPIVSMTVDQLEHEFGDNWQSSTGAPVAYLHDVPGEIRLVPVPTDTAVTGVTARISVKPSQSAGGIPDSLGERYREALAIGAKSRLMLYRDKPWTDMELGAALASVFESEISSANLEASKAFGRARMSSRPSWC